MLQEPSPQQYELEMVTMEQLVPKNHLVRKIDKAIDFEFIRDEVAHLYCKDNGRPPVDHRHDIINKAGHELGIADPIRLPVGHQDDLAAGVGRITSYNVCYTKLLRIWISRRMRSLHLSGLPAVVNRLS